MHHRPTYPLVFLFALLTASAWGQEVSDSIRTQLLPEVTVRETHRPSGLLATSPVQSLRQNDFSKVNAFQVSDALKFFSGLQVKDYGGVGGLKTISVRSLSANYTAVAYDGVALSNFQTGQIDLGRFSLDNVQMITAVIGESDDIFLPASLQVSAGLVNITTQRLLPFEQKRSVKASLRGGSFGTINPSLIYHRSLSKRFAVGVSIDYLNTRGDYPFTQTIDKYTDEQLRRKNSDVERWMSEVNLYGKTKLQGLLALKTSYYDSDRGVPGAARLYNNYSGEREKERSFFLQANYTQPLSKKLDLMTNAKYSRNHQDYTDISNIYPDGKMESDYDRGEYYVNATLHYTLSDKLSFSFANDGLYGFFENSFPTNVSPSRLSWLSALAAKYTDQRFTINTSLLHNYVYEMDKAGRAHNDKKHLSPYLGLSVKPINNLPLRLRIYYKNSYRLPTFGDMYAFQITKPDLKAENAHQYNIGVTYATSLREWLPFLSLSVDAYHNRIENKIVTVPSSSMVLWSVRNIGEAKIAGIDCNFNVQIAFANDFNLQLSATYTYQDARISNDKILPYTSRHSGSGYLSFETPWLTLNYNLIYCGNRYYTETERPDLMVKAYTDQGLSLAREFIFNGYTLHLSAECLNLFDQQYVVVRSYPMPGRSFRLGVKMEI